MLLLEQEHTSYWLAIFPALLLVAIGMSAVAAPLTDAILGAAGADAAGAASGLNTAIARIGGTFAVALLLGSVLAASGTALLRAFHLAALLSALACVISAAVTLAFVEDAGARGGR